VTSVPPAAGSSSPARRCTSSAFIVGPKRSGYRVRDSYRLAPVGRECAAPDHVERARDETPEPCAGCGRGVVYRTEHDRRRQQAICSTRCRYRARKATVEGHDVSEPWGDRLRRLREARGLSRSELAEACNRMGRRTVSRTDIIRYEAGAYAPRLRTFAALARALGVSMDVLLWGEGEAARIAEERTKEG